jgi:hypothetical protein
LPILLAALLAALLPPLLPALLISLLIPLLLLLVALHLLQLPLQFLCLTPQHLFLPALLITLIARALLLGQLFLTFGQLFELLQGFVYFLSALICRIGCLAGLVLIFLRIQFEVEQAGKIAARRTPSSTASSRSERHLNLAERGFGAKQVLEGFLFVG